MGRGFALVATIGVMVLVVMVALAMLGLTTVEQRNATQESAMLKAQANARMALMLAIGELQKTTGPDQRVTAPANIRSDTIPEGRDHWVGVWDTRDYDPSDPGNKAFVRWLVSSANPNGSASVDYASSSISDDEILVFEGHNSAAHVKVPKVALGGEQGGKANYYAYWIEDEGVKANLGWNEGDYEDDEREQIARLSSAPGVDYEVFQGPFNGKVKHPIQLGNDNAWLEYLTKANSSADISLVVDTSEQNAWLRQYRHDMTLGSRGVIADVKNGGLRRDLSLAFEMDGDADVSSADQPEKFNRQVGEFVAGDDKLAGKYDAPGMPVRERFLYRVTKGDGSPFSDSLRRDDSVVRGPNWWAMRDYYNLYKRLQGANGGYTMQPRAYYPNNSATPKVVVHGWLRDNNYRYLSQPAHPYTAAMWDDELAMGDRYVFHPARANYAPVLMGAVGLYSARVINGNLSLNIDPLIYLWNPYNIKLNVVRYGVAMQRGHGGKITFKIASKDAGGNVTSVKTYGPAKTDIFISRKLQTAGQGTSGHLTYLVSDLTMEPGEIVIVSPGVGTDATDYHDAATPGTNLTDSSGITATEMPLTQYDAETSTWKLVRWENVAVQPGDEVRCLYDVNYHHRADGWLTNSAEHFWLSGFLPNDLTISPKDLVTADTNAERVQTVGGNLAGRNWAGVTELLVPDYWNTSQYPDSQWPTLTVTNPASPGKFFFGINSHLLKPTRHTGVDGNPLQNANGVEVQNAVEVFSQFNPFRTSSFVEGHRVCQFNETYSSISKPGSVNDYIQQIGIQFPPGQERRGYWGESFHGGGGSTAVPFIHIPAAPLYSLADFTNANLSLRASEPYKKVGNSHASIFVPANNLYAHPGESARPVTASDGCWLINDALFDRYYLSGIAPAYSIESGGYSATGSIEETLNQFFGSNYLRAKVNPVLRPYLPSGKVAADVVTELSAEDGYKKLGAYSLVQGSFNVNSTSVAAWEALLRANRKLAIQYSNGGSDSPEGTPFPQGTLPASTGQGIQDHWAGFASISDSQISSLAQHIVEQVKARGPFMSISDFVNRQLSSDDQLNAAGALQAALDKSKVTEDVKSSAGGVSPVDPDANAWHGPNFAGDSDLSERLTTEGIAGDIRQADLLRPLGPRLSARSDTFRIRAYGEVRSKDGTRVLATAMCEAVVQRVPEYVDAGDNAWEETGDAFDPSSGELSLINQQFGRSYRITQFRWLASEDI